METPAGDMTQPLTALVAMTPDGVIGRDGDMPWHLGSDLRRFKRLTLGGVLIMGRRTYESIGRPLPGRRTVVITRNPDWSAEGVESVDRPAAAIEAASGQPAYVVGGAQIYRELLDRCDQVWLTTVWSAVSGDTRLEVDWSPFVVRQRSRYPATRRDEVPAELLRLVRRGSAFDSALESGGQRIKENS